jgi:predicted O-methyltransferase YrrM
LFQENQEMELIDPRAQSYAEEHSSVEEDLLRSIASHTYENHPHSHMLSGHLQGEFLALISLLLRPKRILEIGSFVGYSALYLSRGLEEGGMLHTLEVREEEAAVARTNFSRANAGNRILLHHGNALEIIPTLRETWDLVFIDADKTNYINYYHMVLPQVRPGGLIIADNVFFHGEVLEDQIKGENAQAIHAFNEFVSKDPSVEKLMLTIRDGLLIIRKK